MNKMILIGILVGVSGCSTSERLTLLEDKVKAQGIQIRTLQDQDTKIEAEIISSHNRMAIHEKTLADQKVLNEAMRKELDNLKSKFDVKFKQEIMK